MVEVADRNQYNISLKYYAIDHSEKNNSSKISPAKAYIIGVLCGDGCLYLGKKVKHGPNSFDPKVKLSSTDLDFVETFCNALFEAYKYHASINTGKPTVSHRKNGKTYYCKPIFTSYACTLAIYKDLARYENFRTYTWRVPEEIKNSNENIIAMFLRGFFDSEGSVAFNKKAGNLRASTKNKEGMLEISALLHQLGMANTVHQTKKGETVVRVLLEFSKIFLLKVGFSIKRKQKILEEMARFRECPILA